MKTVGYQLLLGVALLSGVVIGYFVGGKAEAPRSEWEEVVQKRPVADLGEQASVKALRRRISELERALAARGNENAVAVSNAVAEVLRQAPAKRPAGGPREWMENLKKNEPVRFAQMTNRFAQMRQRHAERTRNQMEFLAAIDTSTMSVGAQKVHNELQELLARRDELEGRLHQEGLSDDERRELFEEMRDTSRALRELNQKERTNLIEETARRLGFEGDSVQDVASTIQAVIEATDGGGRGPMGPPPDGTPPPER